MSIIGKLQDAGFYPDYDLDYDAIERGASDTEGRIDYEKYDELEAQARASYTGPIRLRAYDENRDALNTAVTIALDSGRKVVSDEYSTVQGCGGEYQLRKLVIE